MSHLGTALDGLWSKRKFCLLKAPRGGL